MIIRSLETLKQSVRKYSLVVIGRADDGCFRVWYLARRASGTRGGWCRNKRTVYLTPAQDCEAHRLGLLDLRQWRKDIPLEQAHAI